MEVTGHPQHADLTGKSTTRRPPTAAAIPPSSGKVRDTSAPLREKTVTSSSTTTVARCPSNFHSIALPSPLGGAAARVASIGANPGSRTASFVLVGTYRRYAAGGALSGRAGSVASGGGCGQPVDADELDLADIATDVTSSGLGDAVSLVGVGGWGGSEVSATRISSLLTVAGGFRAMNRQSRAPPVSMVTGSRLRSFGNYTSSLVTMRCLDHWSVPSGAVASKPPITRIWVSVTWRPKST